MARAGWVGFFILLLIGGPIAPARAQQDAKLQQLLLSSRWCSFSYNKISGASRSEVAQFFANGVLTVGSNAESYSANRYGSVAGQSQGGRHYFWRVRAGDLWLSEDGTNFEPLGLRVTRNSNGHPILHADGKEYSMCN